MIECKKQKHTIDPALITKGNFFLYNFHIFGIKKLLILLFFKLYNLKINNSFIEAYTFRLLVFLI